MNNLPVVSVGQFVEIVELQFNQHIKRPIFGLGKGGVGKTESIRDLAIKLGIGYIDIRLLLYAETDLKGIPYPDSTHTTTVWLQNKILPNVERDGERGILVLDEITSVSRSVRTAAYQLLNERRLGEYELPDGWIIVCLGNGEEDGGDFQGMEGNFANRCSIFNVVPDVEAWKDWAFKNDVNYLVLGYISWRPGDLHTYNPESEDVLFASPRSWKAVSDTLNSSGYNDNDLITKVRVLADVGTSVGNKFIAFCKYKDMAVNPQDIIDGEDVKKIDNNLEMLFMTMQGVIKLIGDNIKKDKINNGIITNETIRRCANGVRWLLSLNSMEHKVMGIKDLVSVDRKSIVQMLLSEEFRELCPELVKFAKKNNVVFR